MYSPFRRKVEHLTLSLQHSPLRSNFEHLLTMLHALVEPCSSGLGMFVILHIYYYFYYYNLYH